MFAKINTFGLLGIEGYPVEIEADIHNGLPGFFLSGVLSAETREAHSRVWNALKNSGFKPEPKKITVNFSPAFVRKEGTSYDLPIAAALLCAYGLLNYRMLRDTAFFGELGLDGSLKAIRGAMPLAFAAKQNGIRRLIVPYDNVNEALLVGNLEVVGCTNINDVIEIFKRMEWGEVIEASTYAEDQELSGGSYDIDFSDVKGQHFLKRAAEIAVSGMHNILMSGPAGTGKTMIARCMPTIMPGLSRMEDIEISKVYSICGKLPDGRSLLSVRPFRSPHHGITSAAFAGGGARCMPGEMSLASGGILFLDELPLFSRSVLEMLRQPMEERKITINRMHGSYTYPADFLLAAAMNNCACGFYPDLKRCRCTKGQIKAYMGRISRPLLERIDICAEANPLKFEEFMDKEGAEECSADIRKRVELAHEIQRERFAKEAFTFNSHMGIQAVEKYCVLGSEEASFIREIFRRKGLSGRTYHKVLKVARTIADMDGEKDILVQHLAEAVELRSIEDKLFGGIGL